MIRMDAIPEKSYNSPKRFGPFTSVITFSALVGLCLGIASIVLQKL